MRVRPGSPSPPGSPYPIARRRSAGDRGYPSIPPCARDDGFEQVYTNDRHLLANARHFALEGVNAIGDDSV